MALKLATNLHFFPSYGRNFCICSLLLETEEKHHYFDKESHSNPQNDPHLDLHIYRADCDPLSESALQPMRIRSTD